MPRSGARPMVATLALAGLHRVAMAEFTFGPFCLSTAASRLTRDGVDVRCGRSHTGRVLLQHQGALSTTTR